MYVKIHKPAEYGGNKSSCGDLVNYLEKENLDKEVGDQEYFFSHDQDFVSHYKVEAILDNNHKGLKAVDSKFYMLTLNPSKEELNHIAGDTSKLKEYTRAVMDQYAESFDRTIDGRSLTGHDLVYFAKVEQDRMYKPEDTEYSKTYSHNQGINKQITALRSSEDIEKPKIKARIEKLEKQYLKDTDGTVILPGNPKEGPNQHVHIIVSRKDMQQKLSLSPLANSKGSENVLNGRKVKIGFNREEFVDKVETIFDKLFDYNRSLEQSFQYRHGKVHDAEKFVQTIINSPRDVNGIAKRLVSEAMQDPVKRKLLYTPTTPEALRNKIQREAIKAVARAVEMNPAGLPVKIFEKTLMEVARGIGRSTGIGY